MKRKAYEDLPLLPWLVAEAVALEPYTGEEISMQSRDQSQVEETERRRRGMTGAEVAIFTRACDKRCQAAYVARASWFMKLLRAKDNRGRDQLYNWVRHWLAAFLRPGQFREESLRGEAAFTGR